jgi:hypothetical protein
MVASGSMRRASAMAFACVGATALARLADATRGEFDRAVAHRISVDDLERPWLTLPKAIMAIDDLHADADPVEMAFLHDHRAHLASD